MSHININFDELMQGVFQHRLFFFHNVLSRMYFKKKNLISDLYIPIFIRFLNRMSMTPTQKFVFIF